MMYCFYLNYSKEKLHVNYNYDIQNKKFISRKPKIMGFNSKDSKTFTISAGINANNGRGFEIHILLIYDKEFDSIVQKIEIPQYKNNKNTFARENKHAVDIFTIDVAPGVAYQPIKIPIRDGSILINCMVFLLVQDNEENSSQKTVKKLITGNLSDVVVEVDSFGGSFRPR